MVLLLLFPLQTPGNTPILNTQGNIVQKSLCTSPLLSCNIDTQKKSSLLSKSQSCTHSNSHRYFSGLQIGGNPQLYCKHLPCNVCLQTATALYCGLVNTPNDSHL